MSVVAGAGMTRLKLGGLSHKLINQKNILSGPQITYAPQQNVCEKQN